MINLILESLNDHFTPNRIDFLRLEDKSRPLRPVFAMIVNDEVTDIMFNTSVFDQNERTDEQLGNLIFAALVHKIQAVLDNVKN